MVGLPTLGLSFAPAVTHGLGHARFIPLGFSRKYWYRDALSEPVRSITSPSQDKRLYLDPHQISLLEGRRVLVVDDTVSTGATMLSGVRLRHVDGRPIPVLGALDAPLMVRAPDGWVPEP